MAPISTKYRRPTLPRAAAGQIRSRSGLQRPLARFQLRVDPRHAIFLRRAINNAQEGQGPEPYEWRGPELA